MRGFYLKDRKWRPTSQPAAHAPRLGRRRGAPARRYLHGGVVVRVEGALGHSRESLADKQLGEGGLRVPHDRGQDVNGRLQERSQACLWGGRRGPNNKILTVRSPPTNPETLMMKGTFLEEEDSRGYSQSPGGGSPLEKPWGWAGAEGDWTARDSVIMGLSNHRGHLGNKSSLLKASRTAHCPCG